MYQLRPLDCVPLTLSINVLYSAYDIYKTIQMATVYFITFDCMPTNKLLTDRTIKIYVF